METCAHIQVILLAVDLTASEGGDDDDDDEKNTLRPRVIRQFFPSMGDKESKRSIDDLNFETI
jgi:hypothetical protein